MGGGGGCFYLTNLRNMLCSQEAVWLLLKFWPTVCIFLQKYIYIYIISIFPDLLLDSHQRRSGAVISSVTFFRTSGLEIFPNSGSIFFFSSGGKQSSTSRLGLKFSLYKNNQSLQPGELLLIEFRHDCNVYRFQCRERIGSCREAWNIFFLA